MCHYEESPQKLRKTGVITLGEDDLVLQMEEKPAEPKSHWAVPPFYFYRREDAKKTLQAVDTGVCGVDAPGEFLAWLCGQSNVYAWGIPGKRYDIRDMEGYKRVEECYRRG